MAAPVIATDARLGGHGNWRPPCLFRELAMTGWPWPHPGRSRKRWSWPPQMLTTSTNWPSWTAGSTRGMTATRNGQQSLWPQDRDGHYPVLWGTVERLRGEAERRR